MKPEDAEEFTQAIGQIASGTYRQVALGVRLGVPKALGLDTRTWVQERLGGYVRMSVEERREVVPELTEGEDAVSNRQAADILGVDESTIREDKAAGNPAIAESDGHVDAGNPAPEERYPELATVPPEHREVIAAELDAMPEDERPAARASLETADVVYSTNARSLILDALAVRVPRDLHEQAARLIPKHRADVMERIQQTKRKVEKLEQEVEQ